jgi:hypothetical protein
MNPQVVYDFGGLVKLPECIAHPPDSIELSQAVRILLTDTNERRQENYCGLRTTTFAIRLRGA